MPPPSDDLDGVRPPSLRELAAVYAFLALVLALVLLN
jgi:hypothetical protein